MKTIIEDNPARYRERKEEKKEEKKRKNDIGIATIDIETDSLKQEKFILGSLAYKPREKIITLTVKNSFQDYFNRILDELTRFNKDWLIYCHNLNFEATFLEEYLRENRLWEGKIDPGGKIVCIFFTYKQFNFKIIDSLQFFQCSQAKAEQEYLGEQIKKDMLFNEHTTIEEYRERCEKDVIGLYRIIEEFVRSFKEEFNINVKRYITISQIGFAGFKKKFKEYNKFNFTSMNTYVKYDFCPVRKRYVTKWKSETYRRNYYIAREGYLGGLVDVFNLNEQKEFYYYDINSMYPAILAKEKFPDFDFYEVSEYKQWKVKEFLDYVKGKHYIVKATVKQKEEFLPVLSDKFEGKLLNDTGEITGVFYSPQFNYFLKRGGEIIKIHYVKAYHNSHKSYVFFQELYEKRLELKNAGHKARATVFKLIMNSSTGKPGQDPRRKNIVYQLAEDYFFSSSNETELHQRFGEYITKVEEKEEPKKFMIVDFSAFMTSYARTLLISTIHKIIEKGYEVYYTDTDSLVTNCDLSKVFPRMCDEKKLGRWKNELGKGKGLSFKAFFPKTYYMRYSNKEGEERIKLVRAGINKQMLLNYLYENVSKEHKPLVKRLQEGSNEEEEFEKLLASFFYDYKVFEKMLQSVLWKEEFLSTNMSIRRNHKLRSWARMERTGNRTYVKRKIADNGLTVAINRQERIATIEAGKIFTTRKLNHFSKIENSYEIFTQFQEEGYDERELDKEEKREFKAFIKKYLNKTPQTALQYEDIIQDTNLFELSNKIERLEGYDIMEIRAILNYQDVSNYE